MARTVTGKVVSNAANKTIAVKVDTRKTHPLYRKKYTSSNKFQAHDEKNEAEVGDTVEIVAVRPISKSKTWKLVKITNRAQKLKDES